MEPEKREGGDEGWMRSKTAMLAALRESLRLQRGGGVKVGGLGRCRSGTAAAGAGGFVLPICCGKGTMDSRGTSGGSTPQVAQVATGVIATYFVSIVRSSRSFMMRTLASAGFSLTGSAGRV